MCHLCPGHRCLLEAVSILARVPTSFAPPRPPNRGHTHFKAGQAGTLHKVTVSVVDGPGLDQRSYLKLRGALGAKEA